MLWVGQHVTPPTALKDVGGQRQGKLHPRETKDKILSLERGTGFSFKAKMWGERPANVGVDWIPRELVGGDAQTAVGWGEFGQGGE